jgi:hypothetical protein
LGESKFQHAAGAITRGAHNRSNFETNSEVFEKLSNKNQDCVSQRSLKGDLRVMSKALWEGLRVVW